MRFHTSAEFSAAREAHRIAYAAWSKIAEHPDPYTADRSPEALAASQAESDTLDRILSFPATSSMEIASKLAFMREREAETWTGYPAWMAQIERELIELQRPCVSSNMLELFNAWRPLWVAFSDTGDDDDGKAHGDAYLAMMAAPCFTPGDFIVKVYANQLGEHGSTLIRDTGFAFELDDRDLAEGMGTHDGASEVAIARDIRECDLGRCLLALGRVDFDADAWLVAARRAHMTVHVVIQTDGSRGIWTRQPSGLTDERHGQRWNTCQALIAGGLGPVGEDRRRAVMDAIERSHGQLVMDCRTIMGEAA